MYSAVPVVARVSKNNPVADVRILSSGSAAINAVETDSQGVHAARPEGVHVVLCDA